MSFCQSFLSVSRAFLSHPVILDCRCTVKQSQCSCFFQPLRPYFYLQINHERLTRIKLIRQDIVLTVKVWTYLLSRSSTTSWGSRGSSWSMLNSVLSSWWPIISMLQQTCTCLKHLSDSKWFINSVRGATIWIKIFCVLRFFFLCLFCLCKLTQIFSRVKKKACRV